ncbi:Rab guanine nucleotide exchange factor SEC2 [Grifola frondosa]|uniref:Rab guanine nucleotide exchange factor SEC2 n=1 Tax=Grifola frondosa TaxID=5627 RepID=A0A1C7LXD1_GRIFR|nr:Rab guanine nucleotide exchange factor SEC2 [Grifola frondosa]
MDRPLTPDDINATKLAGTKLDLKRHGADLAWSDAICINGEDAKLQRHNSDPDAEAMVIGSLRSQIEDLISQVSQLNNKLVTSYNRVSNLEDTLHVTSESLRASELKVSQLELERTQHLSALSTGLLVEKSHVTNELTRLMERATEEAARRGQAESARAEIEKDLDDLSAGLFNQANTMVAQARIGEARSARKLQETEIALKGAEEVVGVLQEQMQALQEQKELADRRVEEMRVTMGKGKWVDRVPDKSRSNALRLMCIHPPYQEFILFVSHLRSIRPAAPQPPAMSTLLPLPFLARLVTEDSDPTVRLDLAPSLNWLSRRSVLAAIHSGQLTVEPMHTAALLEELAPSAIPGNSHNTNILCALCGVPIFPPTSNESPSSTPVSPSPNSMSRTSTQGNSWSSSLFKNSLVQTISTATPSNLTLTSTFHRHHTQLSSSPIPLEPPTQVYIFRLDATSSGLPVSLPLSSQQPGTPTRQSTIYPLCGSGWCLARLRTTCSLWAFVRTSVVEKVWEEALYTPPPSGIPTKAGLNGIEKRDSANSASDIDKKPTLPPRKSKIGALWGSMQRTLSSTKELEKPAANPVDSEKVEPPPRRDSILRSLPPPPLHPSLSSSAPKAPSAVPPPLPKRNRDRDAKPLSRSSTPDAAQKLTVDGASTEAIVQPDEQPHTEISVETVADALDQPLDEAPHTEIRVETSTDALAQPPIPLTRDNSHDDFATPIEELATFPNTPRPSTPSIVPLPPSSPPTPEPGYVSTPPETASVVDGLPPSASPTPPIATLHPEEEKAPSRTVSPVPPPLPRRAAARSARRMSVAAPAAPTLSTATVDAVPAPVREEDESGETTAESSDPALAAPTEQTPAVEQLSESQVSPEEAQGDDSPPQYEEGQDTTKSNENLHATDEKQLLGASIEVEGASLVAPSINGIKDGVQGRPESVHAGPETNGILEEVDSVAEVDYAGYVGDSTWEERTWKELVRLREEMFWARIGGVH